MLMTSQRTSLGGLLVSLSIFVLTILIVTDCSSAMALPEPERARMLVKRDVWSPEITSPSDRTVWRVGQKVQVTWSVTNPPAEVTNSNGKVSLRTANGFVNGPGGLNEPLAVNFSLYDGQVNLTVPDVPARTDYQIILFGDSGNASPYFTISNTVLAPLQDFGSF